METETENVKTISGDFGDMFTKHDDEVLASVLNKGELYELKKEGVFEREIEMSSKVISLISEIKTIIKDEEDSFSFISEKKQSELSNKVEKYKNLLKEQEDKIRTIVCQMYNGVLVPEQLTIRRGEAYAYRCQYNMQLSSIKQVILKNIQAVSEKLTDRNLDILEFVLNAYDENKEHKEEHRAHFFNKKINLIEESYSNELNIKSIEGVQVNSEGSVTFVKNDKDDNDDEDEEYSEIRLTTYHYNKMFDKFNVEIKELTQKFIDEIDAKIKTEEDKIKEIKEKGSHLLMVAEIQKGSDNVNGYK